MPDVTTYIDKNNWEQINNNPGQDYYVLIDMNNKNVHFDNPEAVYKDGYDHIDLTGTGLTNFVDIRGRKQEDSIYGAENTVNFLYGDGVWNFWGHEVDSNTNYNKYVGSDKIVGGNNFNYIHGGKGQDVLIGGTDTNFYSFRKNDGAAIIMPSTGWNYLYFAEVKAKDMTFAYINYEQQEGQDPEISISPTYTPNLGIIAGGTEVVALNYFLGNSRIFDKDTDMTDVKDLIGKVQQETATMDQVKTALKGKAGIDFTIYAPVENRDNLVEFDDEHPTTYTVASVGKAYTLTISDPYGDPYDLKTFELYKVGNNLELRHTSDNIVVLKDYFKLAEGKALKEVNGVSLIEQKLYVNYEDNKGEALNGTYFKDIITAGEDGVTINAGKRDDEITGSTGTDIITGGAGENVIKYTPGNDQIVLTKGEKMTLDFSALDIVPEISCKNKNGDVVFNISDAESVILKNFVKSNVVGANGVAQYTFDGENYESFDNIKLNADNDDLTINTKKKTASYSGTRFDDVVNINAEEKVIVGEQEIDLRENNYKFSIKDTTGNNEIKLSNASNTSTITTGAGNDKITLEGNYYEAKPFVTTVKAGNGNNEIYINGIGSNSITTGNGNDTFEINSASETTIKAGGGKNTIKINDASFGKVVLAEEKIKNTTNIIEFDDDIDLDDFWYTKSGNDLIMATDEEGEETFTIKDQFLTGNKYSTKTYNGLDFYDFMKNNGLNLKVTGSGTVKGTDLNENIITTDAIDENLKKNDKIYAGKGDDRINAGKGKNQIIVKAGDGADTVLNGYGQDTLVFDKGSKIRFGYVNPRESAEGEQYTEYDMRIYHSDNATDYILLEDFALYNDETGDYEYFFDDTSVKTIKVGSKSYKLTDLLERKTIKGVTGTIGNDDIWVNKTGKQNIVADAGSDIVYIGSNDDKNEDNIDPAKYLTKNITPTVYTYTKGNTIDSSEGTFDKVISYANNGGTYYAQSDENDIKVYGNYKKDDVLTGTDDTYYANVNQFTKITDESGDDTLHINDAESSDLTLIFNVTKDYKSIEDALDDDGTYTGANIKNSFQEVKILTKTQLSDFITHIDEYIDDKGNLSLPSIGIDIDYWGDKDSRTSDDDLAILNQYKGYFGGGIETIVANDNKSITSGDVAELASTVANWLNEYTEMGTGNTFDSVEDAFENGNILTRGTLLKVFADNNPWTSEQQALE